MDYTSRMVALLRELRRERNGAVADSMRYYGTPYGLNYGVSLPTLRRIARAEAPDHGFARYLYRQDVRELRLAALHIACRPLAQHPVPAARLTAQGAVALLAAVAAQNEENRQAVLRAAGSLGKLPAEDYVHEELAWRLEA